MPSPRRVELNESISDDSISSIRTREQKSRSTRGDHHALGLLHDLVEVFLRQNHDIIGLLVVVIIIRRKG